MTLNDRIVNLKMNSPKDIDEVNQILNELEKINNPINLLDDLLDTFKKNKQYIKGPYYDMLNSAISEFEKIVVYIKRGKTTNKNSDVLNSKNDMHDVLNIVEIDDVNTLHDLINNVDPDEDLYTEEDVLKAVKRDGEALEYVPKKFMTAELCLEAVRSNGWALKLVPNVFKTMELCLEAVKQNGIAFLFVPDENKTTKLCLEAIKQYEDILEYIPEKLKTLELCVEAVKLNSLALKYVPENLKEEVKSIIG